MTNNVFVLTGAGISAESGLGTFRDRQGEGIWATSAPRRKSPIVQGMDRVAWPLRG